jgi:murein DD-endopeptidase MepM/ murein hydrolase activator NlpD
VQPLVWTGIDGGRSSGYVTACFARFSTKTRATVTDNARTAAPRHAARPSEIRRTAQHSHTNAQTQVSKWTFIQNLIAAPINWRHKHWILAGAVVSVTVLAGVVIPGWAVAMRQPAENMPLTTLSVPLPELSADDPALLAAIDASNGDPLDGNASWRSVSVRPRQTLGDIFHEQNFSATDLARVIENRDNASALRNIHPGDEFAFQSNDDGSIRAMRFDRDDHTRVVVNFDRNNLSQRLIERKIERRTHVAHGTIDGSLYGAGEAAGMSDVMLSQLANAFSYDLDFAHDLRDGDNFTVVYDDVYREGERLRDGDIIAATFVNRGKRYSAFRFTNSAGETLYYTEDGRPLRKSFLRMPVDFAQITSRFSPARLHPILGTMRAHQGVDFAAPTGTPIHAAGEGKVSFRGWQAGYGNVVILQHDVHHSTLYGHMSRFASEQIGQRVGQGQTIGFVGMTGLATGPHVHYEFRIDGQHRDPLTVTMPKAEPLPGTELARFRGQTQPMLAKLKSLEATQLASAK